MDSSMYLCLGTWAKKTNVDIWHINECVNVNFEVILQMEILVLWVLLTGLALQFIQKYCCMFSFFLLYGSVTRKQKYQEIYNLH